MENQFTTKRAAVALLLASFLTACTTVPSAVRTPVALLTPAQLAITQAGFGPTARYVYCEQSSCPLPTTKTLAVAVATLPLRAAILSPLVRSQDISFPLNSPRISAANKRLLAEAASSYTGGDIEIIARSDYVVPTTGQIKVVLARAKAMRSIVAKQAPNARITERREVAGPNQVAGSEQAQQPTGTVRFTHPINVQLKGTPK